MYAPAHRLSGMLSMIAMKHVLAMIVMNHVHVCSYFHALSGMLCVMLTVNACYDCRT